MALAIGLVPFTVQYVCLRAFYALEDNRTTFFLQCLIAGANVAFGVAAVTLLDRPSLVATGLGAGLLARVPDRGPRLLPAGCAASCRT